MHSEGINSISKKQNLALSFICLLAVAFLVMLIPASINQKKMQNNSYKQEVCAGQFLIAKADTANPYLYIISQSGRNSNLIPSSEKINQYSQINVDKTDFNSVNKSGIKSILEATWFHKKSNSRV